MEWFLIALVAAAVCGYAARHGLRARERHLTVRHQVAGVSLLLSEDLGWLGEELGRLDRQVAGLMLDDTSRDDHTAAHASYASAERALPGVRTSAAVGEVAVALADAAHRVTCVRARIAGGAVPDRRTPCFFDVRHGLSTDDVVWTDPVHGTRTVPACASDAASMADGGSPAVRTALVGDQTVAYWHAGAASEEYYRGWFAADVPFLPPAPRRRRGVDSGAVQQAETDARQYLPPLPPGASSAGQIGEYRGRRS